MRGIAQTVFAALVAGFALAASANSLHAEDCIKDRFGNCLTTYRTYRHNHSYSRPHGWGSIRGPTAAPRLPSRPAVTGTPAHSHHTRSAVLDTGYKALTKLGGEEAGYGLYSYVIAPGHTKRNAAFLRQILSVIAPVEDTGPEKSKINVLYIPVKADQEQQFEKLKKSVFSKDADGVEAEAIASYDQSMALDLLHRICASATGEVSDLCMSDISQGPFLFTYASPVTSLATVPPPYLIVDLRPVHERAFPVFVSKFMEQVKRPDFADGERIHNFKLSLLSIVLTAADWIEPVQKAVAGIVHSSSDAGKDGK